jgi:hypothetical protein
MGFGCRAMVSFPLPLTRALLRSCRPARQPSKRGRPVRGTGALCPPHQGRLKCHNVAYRIYNQSRSLSGSPSGLKMGFGCPLTSLLSPTRTATSTETLAATNGSAGGPDHRPHSRRVPPTLGGTLRECGSASLVPRRHLIIRNAGIPLIRTMRGASLWIPCLVSGLDILWRIVRCRWIRCCICAARCVRHRAPSKPSATLR